MKIIDNIFTSKITGIHKDMDLNPLTLAFRNKIEVEYNKYYYEYSIDFVRISLLFSIALYMGFYLLDIVVYPEFKREFLLTRLVVSFPVSFLVFIFSYYDIFRKNWQSIIFIIIQLAGIGIMYMISHSKEPYQFNYFIGLILVMMYNFMFSKLRFIWSTMSGLVMFVIYILFINLKFNIPFVENYMNTFFLASSILFGMLASYFVEYYTRREFYTIYLLNEEKLKVEHLNEILEEKVKIRTNELQLTNLQLTEKNQRLNKSEKELYKHKDKLEELVEKRTKELDQKYSELETKNKQLQRFNDLFVGREFRIKELKDKIKNLEEIIDKAKG
ncbi:MAG: hypothetical protein K9H49_01105 [Bacteroidales bacterium]|nr:hypothetical protein [Bacteroidales bacterium]MCF8403795.1 hypothetical protein [Bacteroidales bacterium]